MVDLQMLALGNLTHCHQIGVVNTTGIATTAIY